MTILDLINKYFQPTVMVIGAYLVLEFRAIADNIRNLNTNVAVLIERTTSQKSEIVELAQRVQRLEEIS